MTKDEKEAYEWFKTKIIELEAWLENNHPNNRHRPLIERDLREYKEMIKDYELPIQNPPKP